MRLALLLAALAACGDDTIHHLSDAPPGAGDAPATDAPPAGGTATVSISLAGVAASGIQVIVTHVDGTPGGTATTDATGAASPTVVAGDAVTAVDPFGEPGKNLYTAAGVQPGEIIELARQTGGNPHAMTVALPTFTGAASYAVVTPYGQGAPGGVMLSGGGSTLPLIALAQDANAAPLAGIWEDHAPNAASLDLSAVPFVPFVSKGFTYAHIPAGVNQLLGAYTIVANEGIVYTNDTAATPSGGDATLMIRAAGATGFARGLVLATYTHDTTTETAVGTTTGFDFAQALPEIAMPSYDPATGDLSWQISGGGPSIPDGAIATLSNATINHVVVAPLLGLLDVQGMSAISIPKVAGFDLSGAWQVESLETLQVSGGFATLRTKGLVSDLQALAQGSTGQTATWQPPAL